MKLTNKTQNRLIYEKSPYLLQHAYNPVDWFPWCDEAFQKAESEDKPIFLSIGYSTCHWCHVMEKESFEDQEVADILNKNFISIKVDREERPDIDHIYMTVCQALTGSGGWPLTIFMTPDKRPFFAGTYFPKRDKYGRLGFIELLEQIKEVWMNKRDNIIKSGQEITRIVNDSFFQNSPPDKDIIPISITHEAYKDLSHSFDQIYGGFSYAPKFPTPHNLLFLLRYWKLFDEGNAIYMTEQTLKSMFKGGIYDHIGFGFSRYSTDNKWLVPHFEKMLYDNALLSMAYTEAYLATGNDLYKKIAEQTYTYILRDMTSPDGVFYSAEDADSEGVEGKFYTWSKSEIIDVLGEQIGDAFCEFYNITLQGNFEGKNIPNLINKSDRELEDIDRFSDARKKLFIHRNKRIHPHKDDKILTSWNGLMIASLAMAGRMLNNEAYTQAAIKAVDFILSKLRRDDGRLLARYRDNEAAILGYADDYVFLIWSLIELYETTYNPHYIEIALELNDDLLKHYWDDKHGGLFMYSDDSEKLIARPKEAYDGATPSANSQAAANLIRLSRLTGDEKLLDKAMMIFRFFNGIVSSQPASYVNLLSSVLLNESPSKEIVVIGKPDNKDTVDMLQTIQKVYLPFGITIFYPVLKNFNSKGAQNLFPATENYTMKDNKATAYVCSNFSCKEPVNDIDSLNKLLRN